MDNVHPGEIGDASVHVLAKATGCGVMILLFHPRRPGNCTICTDLPADAVIVALEATRVSSSGSSPTPPPSSERSAKPRGTAGA